MVRHRWLTNIVRNRWVFGLSLLISLLVLVVLAVVSIDRDHRRTT
jgi:hypothetical protein